MPFIAEVQTDNTGKWYSNDYVFETRAEASAYAISIKVRWMSVGATRVVEVDNPASHQMMDGRPIPLFDDVFGAGVAIDASGT